MFRNRKHTQGSTPPTQPGHLGLRGATKIRTKYLRALEEEHFEVLPRADLRQGLPAHVRRVFSSWMAGSSSTSTNPASRRDPRASSGMATRTRPRRRAKKRRSREGRVLLIASCLVMVGALGLWAGFASDSSGGGGEPAADQINAVVRARGTAGDVHRGEGGGTGGSGALHSWLQRSRPVPAGNGQPADLGARRRRLRTAVDRRRTHRRHASGHNRVPRARRGRHPADRGRLGGSA